MSKDDPTPSSLWLFVIKFCIGIVVLVGIWWELVLPTYGWMLGKVTGLIASTLLGVPVDGVVVKVDGLFNTHTMLEFAVGERRPAMLALHQRVKKALDPHGIFNPGRLYAEL